MPNTDPESPTLPAVPASTLAPVLYSLILSWSEPYPTMGSHSAESAHPGLEVNRADRSLQ